MYIYLSEITGQEADELFEADQKCNYRLVRDYSGRPKASKSRIEQVLRAEKNRLDNGAAFQNLLIREKNTDQLLGILYVGRDELEPDTASIGVCVIKSALNQDVATKACRLVLARLFEEGTISHITAEMHIADEIASRVAQKIPMDLEIAETLCSDEWGATLVTYGIRADDPVREHWSASGEMASELYKTPADWSDVHIWVSR